MKERIEGRCEEEGGKWVNERKVEGGNEGGGWRNGVFLVFLCVLACIL